MFFYWEESKRKPGRKIPFLHVFNFNPPAMFTLENSDYMLGQIGPQQYELTQNSQTKIPFSRKHDVS